MTDEEEKALLQLLAENPLAAQMFKIGREAMRDLYQGVSDGGRNTVSINGHTIIGSKHKN